MYKYDSDAYRKKEKVLWIGVTAGSANDIFVVFRFVGSSERGMNDDTI